MKKKYFLILFLIAVISRLFAQSGNDCSTAILVSSNGCSGAGAYNNTGIAGTIIPTCFGAGTNNTMWFKFVASSPTVNVNVNGGTMTQSMVALLQPATQPCTGTFTEYACSNPATANSVISYAGLSPGTTYYIVVDGASSIVGTFQLCLSSPSQPSNDSICDAINLPANNFCSPSNGYTVTGATDDNFLPSCFSTPSANNGTWFTFTALGAANTFTITGGSSAGQLQRPQIAVMQPSGGLCTAGTYNMNGCAQAAVGQNTVTLQINNLIPGQVYYVLVDGYQNNTGSYQICINSYTSTGSVQNNECSTAIPLCPNVNYNMTTVGATPNSSVDPPIVQWSCNGVLDNTVWFSFTTTNPLQPINFAITTACTGDLLQFEVFRKTTGTPCSGSTNWSSVGCIDFGPTGSNSLSIPITSLIASTTYYIVVDNWPGNSCNFNFTGTGMVGTNAGSDQQVCVNAAPFNMAGVSPGGGTWSGTGITNTTNGTFNPSVAGIGSSVIYYTAGGCTDAKIVTVAGPQVSLSPPVNICLGQSTVLNADIIAQPSTALVSFSNTTPVAIPDGGINDNGAGWNGAAGTFATSTINTTGITSGWSFSSVCLTITHTWDADVVIYLKNPCGGLIKLIRNVGGSGDNFTNTCFTPSATTAIGGGTAPFSGTWIPVDGATAWNAFLSCTTGNGSWQLLAGDGTNLDPGTLQNWTLTLNNPIATPTFTWSPTTNMTGSTTLSPTVTPTTTTTYTLTATDQFGCTASGQVTVNVNALPNVTLTPTNITCAANCNGSLTAAGSGGTSPYTYSWSGGGTTASKTGLCAGTYTVTLTDSKGCTKTGSFTLTAPAILTLSSTPTNVNCSGSCIGGAVTASAAGGVTNYSYSWSGGLGTGSSKTNVCAGTYTVTVTDASGCTTTSTATVNAPAVLVPSASSTNVLCNGACTGTLTGSATGGTTNYTYSWSGGLGTGSSKINVCSGTFSVTVTDAKGCTSIANTTVTAPTALTSSASSTNPTCNTSCNGTLIAGASGGTTNYSYNWSGGLGTGSTKSSACVGSYTVTVTDANGCTSTASTTISSPTALTLSASATNVSCSSSCNGTLTASAGGGTTGYSYTWSGGLGTGSTKSGVCVGSYTVTVTDANGCTNVDTAAVIAPNALVSTATAVDASCNGLCNGTLSASSSGGTTNYSYSWSGGLGTGANKTNVCAGSYTVTTTDANSCTVITSITVTQPATLTASATPVGVTCNGVCNGTLTGSATGGTTNYSYSWGGGLGTGASKSNVCAGTYVLTVTDSKGCTSTLTTTVNAPAVLTSTASSTNLTCNSVCNGTLTAGGSGGTTNYTYSWSGGLGTGSTKSAVCAGTYTVTVTDANLCTSVSSTTITAPALLTLSVTPANVNCNAACNGTLIASAGGGTTGYSYSWGGGLGTGASKSSVCAGNYTATVTDVSGCTATANVTVTQPAALTASATATTANCNGICNGSLTASATGGTTNYTFVWSGGLGSGAGKSGVCAGSYTVTVTDSKGCTAIANSTVTQPAVLTASATATSANCNGICNGTVNATSGGGTTGYSYVWSGGIGSGASKTNVCAGTYTVTSTDANGCTATSSTTVTEPVLLSGTMSCSDVSTPGAGDGSTSVTPSGGTTAYTYLWSTGATTQSLTGLSGGLYNVTVTDSKGCTFTSSCSINEPICALAVPVVTKTNLTCNGVPNGSITITQSGGTTPYTYTWSPNVSTTSTATGLTAGNYFVTVTDSVGCSRTATATITTPSALSLSVTSTNVLCNGVCSGTLSASTSGGTTSYSYSWSGGLGTGATKSSVCTGTYTVTVTDGNGCTKTDSATIGTPTVLTSSAVSTSSSCGGSCDGTVTASANGGTTGYIFSWNNGLGNGAAQSAVCPGSYSVTVTDTNGCTSVSSAIVNTPSNITSSAVSTNATCKDTCNGTLTASATGGSSGYTFTWSGGLGTGSTKTNVCAGTYTVTASDTNGCASISTAIITQPNALAATSAATAVLCNGSCNGTLNASASGGTSGYSYNWSGGLGSGAAKNNVCAGTYIVTVTDTNSCTATSTAIVNQPTAITVTASSTTVLCNGLCDGTLSANTTGGVSGYTYTWSGGLGNGSSVASVCAGSYTVTVTDTNSCTNTATAVVTSPPALTSSATSTTSSCGGTCDGTVTVTANGGTTSYTFAWDNGLGNGASKSGVCPGNYSVTVTDLKGCTSVSSTTVNTPSNLSVSTTFTNVTCSGTCNGTISASATGGSSGYSFSWSGGLGTGSSKTNLCSGSYSITVTDANGCASITTVNLTSPAPLVSSATSTNLTCNGICNGTLSATGTGGTTGYTYSWSGGLGTGSGKTAVCSGSYNVTVTDANGCTSVASTSITAPSALTLSASSTNVTCFGTCNGTLNASASGGITGYSYLWSGGAGTGSSKTNICAGTYTVTVTDTNGCTATATAATTQPTALAASALCTNASTTGGSDGTASSTVNGGSGSYQFLWNNSGTVPNINGLNAGNYIVTVTDVNNCTTTATCTVGDPPPCGMSVAQAATNISCNAANNGSATVTVSSGTTPFTYLWTPNVSTTNSASNLAPGSYSVTVKDGSCTPSGNELVNNGNFSAGNTGFQSGYSYTPPPNAQEGQYWVATSGQVPTWNGNMVSSGDHTNGTGNMMLVNGAATPGTNVWCETINVSQGITYLFSVWISSLTASGPAILQFSINGSATGNTFTAPVSTGSWSQFSTQWNSGSSTTANICIVNQNTSAGANDFALDDISFQACGGSCSTVVNFTIVQPQPLTLAFSKNDVTCSGKGDGVASVTVNGGTSPYLYNWSPNVSTSDTAKNLNGGTYNVSVTDSNNCIIQQSITVNEPTPVVMTSSQTNVSCFGGNDGSITLNVSGGSVPHFYNWSPASTGSSSFVSGLNSGNYLVTISDNKGCTLTSTFFINQPAVFQSSATQKDVSCFGGNNGSAKVTVVGGVVPYTYAWPSGVSTTDSASSLTAGTYVVTVTDFNGCTSTSTSVITQPADLSIIVSNKNDVKCFGNCDGNSTVAGSGGTSPYSYLWNTTPPVVIATAANLCLGAYMVTLTDTNGCTKTQSITINQPPQLSAADTSFNVKCSGACDGMAIVIPQGGTPFNSGNAYTILWSPPPQSGQGTITASGLCFGNYGVSVTDSNGCQVSKSFTINEPLPLILSKLSDSANCSQPDGKAWVIANGATPPYSYKWSANAGNQITDTAFALAPGYYFVTVTDTNQCTKVDTVKVGNNPAPTASVIANPVVCKDSCNGNATVTATGGPAPGTYTYLWSSNPAQNTQNVTGLCKGTYFVTVTDAKNCTVVASDTVKEPPVVTVTAIVDTLICIDGTATLSASGTGGNGSPYTYIWSNGITTNTQQVNSSADICYVVTVQDANGCLSAPDTQCVTHRAPLNAIAITDTIICKDGKATLSAVPSGGIGIPYTMIWYDQSGLQVGTGTEIVVNPPTFPAPVSYVVTVDDNCETPLAADTVVVSFHPLPAPVFIATDTAGCEPLTLTFNGTPPGALCIWDFGDGTPTVSNCGSTTHTFQKAGSYSIKLEVTNQFGCRGSYTKALYITVFPTPDAGFSATPMQSNVQNMQVNFTDSSSSFVTKWNWIFYDNDTPGILGTDSIQNPSFNFASPNMGNDPYKLLNDTGSYPVKLIVTTIYGCKDTIEKKVYFEGIYFANIPNAFTPDGDGLNDYFFPVGIGIRPEQNYKLYIFNRWGDLIFQSSKLNEPWDGTAREQNGGKVQEGVYVWKLEVQEATTDGNLHKFIGHVTTLYRDR